MTTLRLLDGFSGPSATAGDPDAVNLGIEFTLSAEATATAVWWWQAATDASTSARTVGIYPAAGTATLLATGTASPTGSGWQRVELDDPAVLPAGSYRAVAFMPNGQYSATANWWTASGSGGTGPGKDGLTNDILGAPNDSGTTGAGGQSSYNYSGSLTRTTNSNAGGNYWIDVEVETAEAPLEAPIVTLQAGSTSIVEWDDVPGATSYQAGSVDGHGGTSGFVVVADDVTSPFDFETVLPDGEYTGAIRAVKEG